VYQRLQARRSRILFVTCHLPYPAWSGGRLREHELLRRLAPQHDLHVLAISKTAREDEQNRTAFERLLGPRARVEVVPAGRGPRNGGPTQVERHRSPAAASRVAAVLADVDLVHLEGFYLAQHLPPEPAVPAVLAEQNVEFALWRQRARANGDVECVREARATRAVELAAWRRVEVVVAVTEDDRRTILTEAPRLDVRLVPDGADHLRPPRRRVEPAAATILFVGNFAYQPNVDAARFLCHTIFPLVREEVPGARLQLAGNGAPTELLIEGVSFTGRVARLEPYYDRAAVVVCPLRIGGGIKVKMLEALTRGKAIVSTNIGVQGLDEAPVVVRDDPREFAHAVAELLRNAGARTKLESRARAYAAQLPTWDEAAERLAACYEDARSSFAGRSRAVSSRR
jgi:glycosyltransferase involved in cell wall biosynthesis